jgi:hypothetical protein
MHIDHVLYITPHDQLADTFQRLSARLGSTFVDGGIRQYFGTRNFTLPLQNCHYLEVVCPLDHPSSDSTPFGKAVSQRASEGDGWLTWVVAVDDVSKIEKRLGRAAEDESRIEEWLGSELRTAIGSDVEVEWITATASNGKSGIVAVHVMIPSCVVRLD